MYNNLYLDYTATTKVNKEVLDTFIKVNEEYYANTSSLHKLGVESKNLLNAATNQIKDILNTDKEVIYTSGASEANNLIIKGLADQYSNRNKHIITTKLEHASILEVLSYLETKGYKISFVNLDKNGQVDINHLNELMKKDPLLVTVAAVSSELGIIQNIDMIANVVKKYPKCFFHSDMTQAIGKIKIDTKNVDAFSFSAHKFYGLKGIGGLVINSNIKLIPLIHGGENDNLYRSGTMPTPLIVSMAKALRLSNLNIEDNYKKVSLINDYFKSKLNEKIILNSTDKSIANIINISVKDIKPETLLHALEKYNIYISTKSACSSKKDISESVYYLYNDLNRSKSTIRISIANTTTKNDIDYFISSLNNCIEKLSMKED